MTEKVETTLYLHAYYDLEGKFQYWTMFTWKSDGKPSQYGLMIFVSEHKFEVEVPVTSSMASQLAVHALDEAIKKKKADHQAWLMRATFLRNGLLSLPAPDIIDLPPASALRSDDDDIPF